MYYFNPKTSPQVSGYALSKLRAEEGKACYTPMWKLIRALVINEISTIGHCKSTTIHVDHKFLFVVSEAAKRTAYGGNK